MGNTTKKRRETSNWDTHLKWKRSNIISLSVTFIFFITIIFHTHTHTHTHTHATFVNLSWSENNNITSSPVSRDIGAVATSGFRSRSPSCDPLWWELSLFNNPTVSPFSFWVRIASILARQHLRNSCPEQPALRKTVGLILYWNRRRDGFAPVMRHRLCKNFGMWRQSCIQVKKKTCL